MSNDGSKQVTEKVGIPMALTAHSLSGIRRLARLHKTDPGGFAFGPLAGGTYVALVVAVDASGELLGTWTSSKRYKSAESAISYAMRLTSTDSKTQTAP